MLGETLVQRFLLEQELGRGGMGVVYRAVDKWNGEPCAVKVLTGKTDARRFLREAQILSRLIHPAIVRYVGHGVSPAGASFLAMEWVDGTDLRGRLDAVPPSVAETLDLGRRLAQALAAVHAAGIVHRDLKPSNVLLPAGKFEHAKLGDFGVAHVTKSEPASTTLTTAGMIVGTPGYLAPEQLRGGAIDARADLFSLGCILFECLSGRPAFRADSLLALFAKVALEPAPSLREHCAASVPEPLERLVLTLLEKQPESRPTSSLDVLSILEGLEANGSPETLISPRIEQFSAQERRIVPVVVCPNLAGRRLDASGGREQIERIARANGMRLELLLDDSILAVPELEGESALEQALRAARMSKALAETLSERSVAIVSGRMVATSGLSVAEVAQAGLGLASAAMPGRVLLDADSAALLEGRYLVERGGTLELGGERLEERAPRRLLGRQTPFVGRQRELSLLLSTLDACVEESYARALLVSGLPGIGKSRLLSEFLAESEQRFDGVLRTLVARGDPGLSGHPYSMLGTALRRSAGIRGGDSVDERAQKLRVFVELDGPEPDGSLIFPFLGEILGLDLPDSVDPRVRAARRDPPMMSAHVRDAFNAWVKRAAQRGLVIALDDLHWADEPSVRLIDSALGAFPELPLFVLALGRPEVQRAFPRLFDTRDVAELKLGRLSKRASEDLVAAVLGESATPALLAAIVARAEGNAFFLEELVRAGASGGVDNLPDTVLGVIESRLAELEPDARVVLRAASVFGEQCWKSAVESVLGNNTVIRDVPGWLRTLTQREVLVESPQSRFAGQTEYVFRHALLRDASYASFVEADRRLAHDRAARWLDEHGEGAAIVIARHWERALDGERAVEAYTRALVQALRSNDLGAVVQIAERAEQNGAAGAALGRVRLLESEAYTWLGTPDQALHAARQALELLPQQGPEFYTALAGGLEAAVLLGDADAVAGLLPKLDAALTDDGREGREARVASLARVASALVLFGRGDEARALLAAAERLATEPLDDPMSVGHLDHAHAASAMVARDLESAASYFLAAGKAFERAGALRPASGAQANVAAVYLEMGAAGPALASLERAKEMAERAGARYSLGLTELNRGIALTRLGRLDEAIALLSATREELERQGDRRLAASASCARAEALIAAGRKGEASEEAERAVATAEGLPSSRAAALAMLACVKLSLGSVDVALQLAERADSERQTTTMEEREALLELVLTEAELQSGRTASAHDRLARVAGDLLQRADSIKTPELRQAFLEDVPEHARLLSLARQVSERSV